MSESLQMEIEDYFDRLWPICRSITGNGLRNSFRIIQEIIPLVLHETASGTEVFDWTVPDEWNIRDAFIITPDGTKIANFQENNLHVVNYSLPVDREMTFEELVPHLHYKEDLPDAIPYVTSYYQNDWGFCIDYHTYKNLSRNGIYRVKIDSTLEKGSLTFGDLLLKGESEKEIMFSSYLCHPSMANNELSGPLLLAFLYRELRKRENRKFSYRFIIAPETIGAISYLHAKGELLKMNMMAGYIFTCCGDSGPVTYKASREDDTLVNKITRHVLNHSGIRHNIIPYDPVGSDERQYGSPGFNLPVGVLMRTPFSQYPEYHTSLDNKDLMDFRKMTDLIGFCIDLVRGFELNAKYENQVKFGEPFLRKRKLFNDPSVKRSPTDQLKMRLRLLNFLDGTRDLVDICDRYGYSILETENEINQLIQQGLIK
jgi:aminopeptidase-like protein